MFYELQTITTDKFSGHTYVLVHFWPDEFARSRGDAPSLVNDFLMQLRPTGERIVTDAQGRWKRKDGSFLDRNAPDAPEFVERNDLETETFDRNLVAEIAENVERFMKRAELEQYSGDHTHREGSEPMVVKGQIVPQGQLVLDLDDAHDPHNILKHPGVAAIREQITIRKTQQPELGGVEGAAP